MSKIADSIRRGLQEAVAYAEGEGGENAYRIHVPQKIDVKAIRTTLGHDAGRVRESVRIQRQHAAPLGTRVAPAGRADTSLSSGD